MGVARRRPVEGTGSAWNWRGQLVEGTGGHQTGGGFLLRELGASDRRGRHVEGTRGMRLAGEAC